ncbi:MAG: hypothetical protein ABL859_00780, partial [Methylotenera sp.]
MNPTRFSLELAITLVTILVLFVSGAVTALRYRQLPGDQRIPWIDKNLNDIVHSIGAENALPFETA